MLVDIFMCFYEIIMSHFIFIFSFFVVFSFASCHAVLFKTQEEAEAADRRTLSHSLTSGYGNLEKDTCEKYATKTYLPDRLFYAQKLVETESMEPYLMGVKAYGRIGLDQQLSPEDRFKAVQQLLELKGNLAEFLSFNALKILHEEKEVSESLSKDIQNNLTKILMSSIDSSMEIIKKQEEQHLQVMKKKKEEEEKKNRQISQERWSIISRLKDSINPNESEEGMKLFVDLMNENILQGIYCQELYSSLLPGSPDAFFVLLNKTATLGTQRDLLNGYKINLMRELFTMHFRIGPPSEFSSTDEQRIIKAGKEGIENVIQLIRNSLSPTLHPIVIQKINNLAKEKKYHLDDWGMIVINQRMSRNFFHPLDLIWSPVEFYDSLIELHKVGTNLNVSSQIKEGLIEDVLKNNTWFNWILDDFNERVLFYTNTLNSEGLSQEEVRKRLIEGLQRGRRLVVNTYNLLKSPSPKVTQLIEEMKERFKKIEE